MGVRRFINFGLFLFSLTWPAWALGPRNTTVPGGLGSKNLEILKKIYEEVKEFGHYPGENFFESEFFIGAPDDDDTNKDQHVVVLIEDSSGGERMLVQITFLRRSSINPKIKNFSSMKNVLCFLSKEKIEIISSDFADADLQEVASGLLRAIRDKKRLLKEGGRF